MSQTSTSHLQWISRAVAAAKAGNQSVAKIQLQKAAEAEPDDPAVWLWLGWLADSPASAAQCLELARTDERFQKIAEAGIEFSRALAGFNLDDLLTPALDEEPDESLAAIADDAPSRSPVESVEEVAAAVESLQFDDDQEDRQNIDAESIEQDVADPAAEVSASLQTPENTDTENNQTQTAEPEPSSESDESAIDHSVTDPFADSEPISETGFPAIMPDGPHEPAIEQEEPVRQATAESEGTDEDETVIEPASQATADSGLNPEDLSSSEAEEIAEAIEAELMKAASQLLQLDDDTTSTSADECDTLEQAVIQQKAAEDNHSQESTQTEQDATAETPVAFEAAAEGQLEPCDEAEGDFDFADDDPTSNDLETEEHPALTETTSLPEASEATIIDSVTSATHEDPWLDQTPVDASQAPHWRKAQSDWFTADGSSESKIEQPPQDNGGDASYAALDESADRPVDAVDLSEALHEQNALDNFDHDSSDIESRSPALQSVDSGTELLPDGIDTLEQPADSLTASPQDEPPGAHAVQTPPPPPAAGAVARVTPSDVWQKAAAEKSGFTNPVEQPAPVASPADPSVFAADEDVHVPPTADRGDSDPLNRRTVLVVDDSPTVRKLVSITLEKRGYRVVSAFDGVAAIKEIASHNPSMILMDVNMPRLDGYQLCKLVKKHETTRDIPVLMLTGTDGMFDRLRGRLVGCAGYIAKPFTPEDLVSIVEQHIHQRQGS